MSQTTYLPGEDVQAFYFAASDKPLFGIYHLPPPGATRQSAIVLCPPLEQEYNRCHRAYRQLAVRLSRAGFPVLRFDYSGTGDSAGDDAVHSLSDWQANTAAAIDEAKRRSGLNTVYLVGLRLGAALAALAALGRSDITGLVLWEPVVSGAAYLEELTAWHQDKLWYFLSEVQAKQGDRPTELLGFALTDTMLSDLNALNLLSLPQPPAPLALLIESGAEESVQRLQRQLETLRVKADYQQVDGPRVWSDDPDKALVPQQVLQAIVNWMSEARS